MTTQFDSGRSGRGGAYVSDRSGSLHARFMRRSAWALAPLGTLAAWIIVGLVGAPYEAARAQLGSPFPALVLIAFIGVALWHARLGVDTIVEDYVHDQALKAKAIAANKWLTLAIGVVWALSILLIAAPK
jgi:succinate dehydrogenase / fumarate reductase membrane anchor subunit